MAFIKIHSMATKLEPYIDTGIVAIAGCALPTLTGTPRSAPSSYTTYHRRTFDGAATPRARFLAPSTKPSGLYHTITPNLATIQTLQRFEIEAGYAPASPFGWGNNQPDYGFQLHALETNDTNQLALLTVTDGYLIFNTQLTAGSGGHAATNTSPDAYASWPTAIIGASSLVIGAGPLELRVTASFSGSTSTTYTYELGPACAAPTTTFTSTVTWGSFHSPTAFRRWIRYSNGADNSSLPVTAKYLYEYQIAYAGDT